MACFFLDLASLLVYNYSTVWPAGFILVAECVASSVEAMALLNDTTEDKLDHSKPSTDHILLITFLTWLFVVTCILLFFYYHWQVCRYLVTTKQGPLWSDSYSNYYPGKRTRKNQREYWSVRLLEGRRNAGHFQSQAFPIFFYSFAISCLENMKYCHCYAMNLTVDRISGSLTIICWVKALTNSNHDVWEIHRDWNFSNDELTSRLPWQDAHHELYINVAMVKHREYDFAGEAQNSGQ